MLILWRGSWPNPCAIFLLSLMCLLFMKSTQSNFISIRFLNPELYSWGITWHLYLLSPYRSQTKYVPHWTHVYDRLYLSSRKICFGKKNEKHMRNRVAVLFIIIIFFFFWRQGYVSRYSADVLFGCVSELWRMTFQISGEMINTRLADDINGS